MFTRFYIISGVSLNKYNFAKNTTLNESNIKNTTGYNDITNFQSLSLSKNSNDLVAFIGLGD